MIGRRSVWLAAVGALALAAGCGPKVKPGLKVVVTPAPDAKITGPVGRVTATFDRPMVGPAELQAPAAHDPPLRLQPEVPGKFRWLDARVLAFIPDGPLPGSARFQGEVRAGTKALDGFGLDKPFRWAFETERLRVTFTAQDEMPPLRWATPDQKVRIELNQPARVRDVEKHCDYASGKQVIEAVVDGGGDPAEARQRFTLTPKAPLALATKWRFVCTAELTGVDGPLGLDVGGRADGAVPANEVDFETYGPLQVVSVAPQGAQISPDEAAIVVTFTNPLAVTSKPPDIHIDPPVDGFPERAAVIQERLSYSVRALKPNTRYKITIGVDLADKFGQHLAAPHEAAFSTGDGTPRLDVETGAWVVESSRGAYAAWARNLTRIEAEVVAVPEAKVGAMAALLDWWDTDVADVKKIGLRATSTTIAITGRRNQWEQIQIDPAKLLAKPGASTPPAPPLGFYYVALRAPEQPPPREGEPQRPNELLLNFTDLGVTAKLSAASGLVWVTRLDGGQPQPGAEVTIRDAAGRVRWHGTTDADGVAVTPGRAQLLPEKKRREVERRAEELAEGEGEGGEEGDVTGPVGADLLVFAKLGRDVTWVNPERTGGLTAWNFHVDTRTSARADQLRGFLHSDRGLYRPGDTVRLRGLARTMRLGSPLRVPAAKKARVTVRDPRGEELLTRAVALDRFGSFAFDVPLSEGARLGDYQATAALPDGSFTERFSVEQYRTATFEVKVQPPAREPIAGGELKLTADARYLYGAPVRGGTLTWRVYRRQRTPHFPKLAGFQFEDRAGESYGGWASAAESLVEEQEQRLDKNGQGRLAITLKKEDMPSAQDLMVTAEVQDETHQTIAANLAVPAHRAGIYFGIAAGSPLGAAGTARAVKLIAVDLKGNRVAASGTFRAMRRDWTCAWEAWGFRGSYRCEKKDVQVDARPVTIGAGAPLDVRFTPATPGEYLLFVEGADPAGNSTSTSAGLWAWGEGVAAWEADDSERFEIVADKESYQVGETARLLLKTTVRDAVGLLTVERDGVLERRPIKVGAGTTTVEVPIREGYGPNVYASVMLVKGRTGKGPRGLPVMRMGLVQLSVDTQSKRLAVTVTTDRPTYRPGDQVTARLRVTDTAGAPVAAQVALSAADEGVLSLIAFKTPDPLAAFYAPWALGVATATQYERLARLPEPGQERYATGGDGAGAPGTFRSRFLATAYWNPRIETDAAGEAQVTFAAPDNLTAYRLMAVAADTGERFGSGEQRLTVRKPLQLLGAMPRFLNVGDQARGGVLLTNETGKAGTAVVEASVTGAKLERGARQEIAVPAGGRVPVTFPLRAERPGEVRLRVKAELGGERDGVELRVPVGYPAPVETEVVAAGQTEGEASIPVRLPAGALPASVTLELSTDPDGVAGLEEGLRDLIEYPYGCLEQTTSRLIPLVAVEELAKSLKLPGLDGPQLQRFIRTAIGKIERFQTDEGGFSLWLGGKPEPYLTAFALWGLKLAADAGHPVRKSMMEQGVAWLRAELGRDVPAPASHVHDELGEMGSRAFAVHVLGLMGHPDPGFATKLLESRAGLPRFGTAFLARALALNLGADHPSVGGLLDELARAAEPKGAYAMIREPSGRNLAWYMSDDLRTTAIATDAFLDLRPSEPKLPKLVKALLAERRGGRWDTTQDALYALVALTHYVKSRPATSVSVSAKLGAKPVLGGPLTGKTVRIRRATLPLDPAQPPAEPLTVRATGGEVFYSALLRFRRDLTHQQAGEHGMTIRRQVLDPATDVPIDPAKGVKVGSMVRVRVSLSSPEWRTHVAVDDPLPAGLEAVNTRLVTSGGVPQRPDRRRGTEEDLESSWYISQRELRDDRVLVFVDELPPGAASFEYLARATTPGTFVVPGTSVQEMYRPEVGARTAPETFVVTGP